jgi:hypothetical protein
MKKEVVAFALIVVLASLSAFILICQAEEVRSSSRFLHLFVHGLLC